MGYTHFWELTKPFTKNNWNLFCQDVKNVFDTTNIPLAGGLGSSKTKPVITKNYISFNGVGEYSHEDCTIRRTTTDLFFCKTDRKPYDKVVVTILKLAKKYNNSIILFSDGGDDVFKE